MYKVIDPIDLVRWEILSPIKFTIILTILNWFIQIAYFTYKMIIVISSARYKNSTLPMSCSLVWGAIDVGGVEKRDATIYGMTDESHHVRVGFWGA